MDTKENRKKWTKALRSEVYKQGTEALMLDGFYCCLGVLCVVAGIKPDSSRQLGGWERFHGEYKVAPKAAMEFVGLADSSGGFGSGALVRMNDGGCTFSEIADMVDSEPDGLFVD